MDLICLVKWDEFVDYLRNLIKVEHHLILVITVKLAPGRPQEDILIEIEPLVAHLLIKHRNQSHYLVTLFPLRAVVLEKFLRLIQENLGQSLILVCYD